MQIDTKINTIESAGLGATGGFSIKTTAAAFQLLSSGLYSNKIRAVVRELSSNAVDAHTMVQRKDTPIEVKLPNSLDSQFYVKDFGPGLSHDDVMHMYTTYFDSSKQKSNDFIGGFGVGSKSPFAYTDSFTVESRHNGTRSLYTAFIGEDNTPQIAQIGTFPMEEGESTGLTVAMPVKPSDFSSFEREAGDLFQWFDTKPTLLGTPREITVPSLRRVANDIAWRDTSNFRDTILVRMGQVVYSVDKYKDFEGVSEEVRRAMSGLARFQPLLDVPIGKMSVAASREDIAYDKATKEYLNKRLPEVYQLAMKEVVATLQGFDLSKNNERREAFEFLQKYNLHTFCSDQAAKEMQANNRSVPELNKLLSAQGISADKFLPILLGLDEPSPEQRKVVHAVMPYTRDRIEAWFDAPGSRWDKRHVTGAIKMVEIDISTSNIYAERARKVWATRTPSHAAKTIALRRMPDVDDAQYETVRDALIEQWGLRPQNVVKLSSMLSPEDKAKYEKTQRNQSVPASTFFSNRPSICTSDLKSFYYIERDNRDRFVPPEGWDVGPFNKMVEAMQENAAVSKALLKDMGADQATLSRVYTIDSENMEKVKTFPGAKSLTGVIEQALDNASFRSHWNTLPVYREKKNITVEKLSNPRTYDSNGEAIVKVFEQTQLGQAVAWLKTIPEWSYNHNEKRPDEVQYVFIGTLLSNASKSDHPLTSKFVNADIVMDRVLEYYPMVQGNMHNHSYRMPPAIGMEIAQYVQWKDSKATTPFLEGVTTLPGQAILENKSSQEEVPSTFSM